MSRAEAIIQRQKTAQPDKFPSERDSVHAFIQASGKTWPTKKPYRHDQFDKHNVFPYLHCKSHQLTADGKLKTKDDTPIPASPGYLLAILNHHADRPCTTTLRNFHSAHISSGKPRDQIGPRQQPIRTLYDRRPHKKHGQAALTTAKKLLQNYAPHTINPSEDPSTIDRRPFDNLPIQTIQYGFTRKRKSIDKSITALIRADITRELQHRLSDRPRQGWYARHEPDLTNKDVSNPMLRLAYNHRSSCHTQTLHVNEKYRTASHHIAHGDDTDKKPNTKDPATSKCPFCTQNLAAPTSPGNARHAHCLCTNITVCNIRNLANTALNDTLQNIELLTKSAPNPTTVSITETIGKTLQTADTHPDYTLIVTTKTQLQAEINRLHRINNQPPPPHHPYQYALLHTPLLVKSGLLPISPPNTTGTDDPITAGLHLGLLPQTILGTLTAARKRFISQAKHDNNTEWLNKYYHDKCSSDARLAALFPESESKDDDGDKILTRRSVAATLRSLQNELFLGLRHRATKLYQISIALVKGRQYRICKKDDIPEEEELLTPTRAEPARPERKRKRKETDTTKEIHCPNYLCRLKLQSNPNGGGKVTKDNGDTCGQCTHHRQSTILCTELERIVRRKRNIQELLASKPHWSKLDITTTLLNDRDISLTVHTWHPSKKAKTDNELRHCPLTDAAFQMLAHTILRRAPNEFRFYDKALQDVDTIALSRLTQRDRCTCECPAPSLHLPKICRTCRLPHIPPHPSPQPRHCRSCHAPLPPRHETDPNPPPFDRPPTTCATCTIGLLCHFNQAAGRFQRLEQNSTPTNRYHTPLPIPPRPTTAKPDTTATHHARPQPQPPPPRPAIIIDADVRPRRPTASELFPIDPTLESSIRTDILNYSGNGPTHLTQLKLQGTCANAYNPSPILTVADIIRLKPATSVDQYLNDDLIKATLILFWKASNNENNATQIGFIPPNHIHLMERDPNSLTSQRAIRRTQNPAAKWRAHAATDILLLPYCRDVHWSLGIHDMKNHKVLYYEGFNTGSNLSQFHNTVRNTIYKNNPTIQFIPTTGPKQTNTWDCGVTLLLVADVWYFHPDPTSLCWDDLMKIQGLIPHFRRVIIVALSTGSIQNIFASCGPSGLPFTQLSLQTRLPFAPIPRPMAAPTDHRPQEPRTTPTNPTIDLLSTDEESDPPPPLASPIPAYLSTHPIECAAPHLCCCKTCSNDTTYSTLQSHRDIATAQKRQLIADLRLARHHPRRTSTSYSIITALRHHNSTLGKPSTNVTGIRPRQRTPSPPPKRQQKIALTHRPPPIVHYSSLDYLHTQGSISIDGRCGCRSILDRLLTLLSPETLRQRLQLQGIDAPPHYRFAWGNDTAMLQWLDHLVHRGALEYNRLIHGPSTTVTTATLPPTNPLRSLIELQRLADLQADTEDWTLWQKEYLHPPAEPPPQNSTRWMDGRLAIGLGSLLDANIDLPTPPPGYDRNSTTKSSLRG